MNKKLIISYTIHNFVDNQSAKTYNNAKILYAGLVHFNDTRLYIIHLS